MKTTRIKRSIIIFSIVFLCITSVLPVYTVMADADDLSVLNIPDEDSEKLTELDLGYWYKGIDEDLYSGKIVSAAFSMPSTGSGYCAAWVAYVYQKAGLGYFNLNANDIWYNFGRSSDTDQIKAGMIIAVPHSPTSALGYRFGHTGVIVKNPAYTDVDTDENRAFIKGLEANIEALKQSMESDDAPAGQTESFSYISASAESIFDERTDQHIEELQESLEKLRFQTDHNCVYSVRYGNLSFEYDADGNEKWIVLHNTDRIEKTSLSRWLYVYDMYNQASWGWGHTGKYRYLPFTGDIPGTVPFVYHEKELTVEEVENTDRLYSLYNIDFDNMTDEQAYKAISDYCAVTWSTVHEIELYGGAKVDNDVYERLLSEMTPYQLERWKNILLTKRKEDEERRAREEAARQEETTEMLPETEPETTGDKHFEVITGEISAEEESLPQEEETTETETPSEIQHSSFITISTVTDTEESVEDETAAADVIVLKPVIEDPVPVEDDVLDETVPIQEEIYETAYEVTAYEETADID